MFSESSASLHALEHKTTQTSACWALLLIDKPTNNIHQRTNENLQLMLNFYFFIHSSSVFLVRLPMTLNVEVSNKGEQANFWPPAYHFTYRNPNFSAPWGLIFNHPLKQFITPANPLGKHHFWPEKSVSVMLMLEVVRGYESAETSRRCKTPRRDSPQNPNGAADAGDDTVSHCFHVVVPDIVGDKRRCSLLY